MDWRWLQFLPADTTRSIALRALRSGWAYTFAKRYKNATNFALRTRLQGVGELLHPIGLAAGFDRNATCPRALADLGFSFLEIGTVTPRAQTGKQRIERLPEQFGLLDNRACHNDGMDAVLVRLHALTWQDDFVPLAVNIGKNKNTADAGSIYDYLRGIRQFQDSAHFIVLNLANAKVSIAFIRALTAELDEQRRGKVWLKLAPNLQRLEFQQLVTYVGEQSFGGLVLTDTQAGKSGHSLASISISYLEWAYQVLQGELPLISSGGILTGTDIAQRILRGANAVEIYTAFVYFGVNTISKLLAEMTDEFRRIGCTSIDSARGIYWQ